MKNPITKAALALSLVLCGGLVATSCTATKTQAEIDRQEFLATVTDDPSTPDVDEGAAAAEESAAIERGAEERTASGLVKLFTMFVPGSSAFEPGLYSLALLGFPRVRSNGKKAIKKSIEAGKKLVTGDLEGGIADIGGAIRGVLAIPGVVHSNSDPLEILRGAHKASVSKGQTARAARIQSLIDAELESQPAPVA